MTKDQLEYEIFAAIYETSSEEYAKAACDSLMKRSINTLKTKSLKLGSKL